MSPTEDTVEIKSETVLAVFVVLVFLAVLFALFHSLEKTREEKPVQASVIERNGSLILSITNKGKQPVDAVVVKLTCVKYALVPGFPFGSVEKVKDPIVTLVFNMPVPLTENETITYTINSFPHSSCDEYEADILNALFAENMTKIREK